MAIRASFDIHKPETVSMRLTVVMTVAEWKQVRDALAEHHGANGEYWHPATELNRGIGELIRDANKDFNFYGEEAPEVKP